MSYGPTERIHIKAMEAPTEKELQKLIEIWHISRVHSNSRYERMLYTSKWFAKEFPEHSSTWAYKTLERQLAGTLRNPLTRKEYSNVMAEARVHERIPKEFYQGEASGMRDIAKQYRGNPPGRVKIYQTCIELKASKAGMPHECDEACKRSGHNYKHSFKKNACVFGLPNGSILIK
jgi:hypothetical protein